MRNLIRKLLSKLRWFRNENFVNWTFANLLGLQILRVLFEQVMLNARPYRVPKGVHAQAKTFKKDGIVVINDFLDKDVFADLQNEWRKERKKMVLEPCIAEGISHAVEDRRARVHYKSLKYQRGTKLFDLLEEHIHNNDFVRQLGSTVVRRKIKFFSPLAILVHQRMDEGALDLDSNIFFHPDVSFYGVKIFLLLNDIDKGNGAFTYAKGSHKLTFNRFKFEYLKSIRYSLDRKKHRKSVKSDPKTGRGIHCLTREEENEFNVVGTPMEGKANTLVMFNIMGFHRRGDFVNDRPRELVVTGFRG